MAVKPGTPHPTRKGLVMGKNGSYVSKTTYAKQVKAANAPKEPVTKPVTRSGPVKGPVPKNNSAVRLPNSSRAGVNLPRAGASAERTYASSQKPKPAAKPTASKPNPYTSGKPNPNTGGGVKGSVPKGGSLAAYKNDIAALKRLVKAGGPLASQAAKRLAVLGVRVAPGAAVAGAIAGSAGRPGAAQMSKLGLRPGQSTKTADAPVYNTPLNQSSKPKPKPKPTTTAASKPKPARQNSSGSSSGGSRPSSGGSRPASKPATKPTIVDGKTVKRVGPVNTPADKPG